MAKNNTIKKFALPPAKILIFNLKGKAIEDIDSRDDFAYLAKRGFTHVSTDLVPNMRLADWARSKSSEEINKAFNALAASPNPPRWMVRLLKRPQQGTADNPTHPAA